jgi:Ca2+-binding RTX toxin-like protein
MGRIVVQTGNNEVRSWTDGVTILNATVGNNGLTDDAQISIVQAANVTIANVIESTLVPAGQDLIRLRGVDTANITVTTNQEAKIDFNNYTQTFSEWGNGATYYRIIPFYNISINSVMQAPSSETGTWNFDNSTGTRPSQEISAIGNVLYGDATNNFVESISAGAGNDTIYTYGGDDRLYGDDGHDLLFGGLGNDYIHGGTGKDTVSYADLTGVAGVTVDLSLSVLSHQEKNAVAQNTGGGGLDKLISIENVDGSKNGDMLLGSAGNNVFGGGAGADTISGGGGIDEAGYWYSTTGVTVTANSSSVASAPQAGGEAQGDVLLSIENITGSKFADIITGDAGANYLNGNHGNDLLIGVGGNDTLFGSTGNDTFIIDGSGYTVIESSGVDLVQSSVSFILGSGVEHLTLTGELSSDGTGNAGANNIVGNAATNVLNGMGGNDTLAGGSGADFYVFNSSLVGLPNVDRITDFSVADDTIRLENTGANLFTALTVTGTLNAAAFWTGAAAHDSDDRIIYNAAIGDVWYDADGTGGTAAIKFAILSTGLAVTNADFFVI